MPFKRRKKRKSQPHVVDAYVALYRELLGRPGIIFLEKLEMAHRRVDSSLHRSAHAEHVNLSAFVYAAERLPFSLPSIVKIIVAPSEQVFVESGYREILAWKKDDAGKRRRRAHHNGGDILAMFMTSLSDFDDLVPSLCAYQIEWNAMHRRLAASDLGRALANGEARASEVTEGIRRLFGVNRDDWNLFLRHWPSHHAMDVFLKAVAQAPKKMVVERLPLHRGDFEHSVADWFDAVWDHFSDIDGESRPVYIVSSNNHSLANLISGYASAHEDEIVADTFDEICRTNDDFRHSYRFRLKEEDDVFRSDFLYYALRVFLDRHPDRLPEKIKQEEIAGLRRFTPDHHLHLEAQVIELHKVDSLSLDPCLRACPPRLRRTHGVQWIPESWKREKAIVFNVDYPLGLSAYFLMKLILARMKQVRGVFVLGKSAAMIGRLGDIMIPREVRDIHSGNLYRLHNAFSVSSLLPYLAEAAVFDEQRTLTVMGTFLHSRRTVKDFQIDNFTGIEMEAGPYLSAIDEYLSGLATPRDAVVDVRPDFPMGILHYTSDTPYNLRASLLSHRMGLAGLEGVYACSRAIFDAMRTPSSPR